MTKKEISLILAVAILGLILSVPYDLSLSSALYNQSNLLGRFGEAFGEFPGILVGALSCAALVLTRNKQSKFSNLSSIVFGGLFFILLSAMAGLLPYSYKFIPLWAGIVIFVLIVVSTVYLLRKIPTSLYPKLRRIAWVGIITLVSVIVTVNLVKMGWSRVRFRDMESSTAAFTPWYLPQGFLGNAEWASFPSGHVADAGVIFVFTLLPTLFVSLKKHDTLIRILCYLWVAMVMVSRIIMGAHFLSDTIVGALFAISQFLMVTWLFKVPDLPKTRSRK